MTDSLEISVVVPLFNEVDNVVSLYRAICESLEHSDFDFELILVDDGSTDGTLETITALHKQDSRVRVIRLLVNSGQTVAMQIGMQRARGEIIVTLDGDLQNDPRDIPLLVSRLQEGYDLVAGWRKNRQDRLFSRRVPSRLANWCIARFLGIPTHDLGCTLKAYRAALVRQIPLYSDLHRFIPAVCSMASTRIDEVIVRHHPRRLGKSKYGISRTGRVLLDALTVKMLLSFGRRPMHWFGYWAFISFLIAGVVGMCAMILVLRTGSMSGFVVPGITIVWGYLGVQLLFSGIFGEIIVHTQRKDRVGVLVDTISLGPRSGLDD